MANVNYASLDFEEKKRLLMQGALPQQYVTDDLRRALDLSQGVPLTDLPNTGTVAMMSTEALEAELARRKHEENQGPHPKMVIQHGDHDTVITVTPQEPDGDPDDPDDADDDEDEPVATAPYDKHTAADLRAELQRRADRDGEPADLSGNKADLVARLETQDESEED